VLDDGVLRIGLLQHCPDARPDLRGEVLPACLDGTPRRAVDEARRLVEGEAVDVLLAYPDDDEGYALALYVRSQPDKTLVLGSSALQATTLDVGAPNVFRFAPDAAQQAAGLGTYAYEALGWRRARIVREPTQFALEQAHAFAVEFCRRGGELVDRGGDGAFVSRGRRASVGGVVSAAGEPNAAVWLRTALAVAGDLSDGHEALRRELAVTDLDENGQVIVDVRLRSGGRTVQPVKAVEQTFGGAFTPDTSPPVGEPAC
jgi:ABC-type branched-subunit amino acid transport system substrate-binding protein